MKIRMSIVLSIVCFSLISCTNFIFPIKASIEEGHYRFENFKNHLGGHQEILVRGCLYDFPYSSKYHSFVGGRQYLVDGEEKFMVQASLSGKNITGIRYVWVPLTANFEENKSYMLNRKLNDFDVSIWIQEVDTGIRVSSIASTTFPRSRIDESHRMKKMCGDKRDPNMLRQEQIRSASTRS